VRDYRFPPIRPEELDELEFEISVLTPARKIAYAKPEDFQIYANGGVSGNHVYHYIQALYTLGRIEEADHIFHKMLEGYHEGVFQGGVNFKGYGKGLDWKKWDGSPCGYEGYLVDNYFALTCYITGQLKRGVPFPEKFK